MTSYIVVNYACVPIPVCFSFFSFFCSYLIMYVGPYVCFLSVSLSLWGIKPYPTYSSVCLIRIYIYILYICNQATSFDGVVPSGSFPLYFYLFELLFCFLLWKIKYLSIYLSINRELSRDGLSEYRRSPQFTRYD